MFKTIEEGRYVAWGRNVYITPDGIRNKRKLIPFNFIDRYYMKNGTLFIIKKDKKKVKIFSGDNNFHPCYLVFDTIMRQQRRN